MYITISKIRKIICLSEGWRGHRYSCYIEMLRATSSSLSFFSFNVLYRKHLRISTSRRLRSFFQQSTKRTVCKYRYMNTLFGRKARTDATRRATGDGRRATGNGRQSRHICELMRLPRCAHTVVANQTMAILFLCLHANSLHKIN